MVAYQYVSLQSQPNKDKHHNCRQVLHFYVKSVMLFSALARDEFIITLLLYIEYVNE